MENMVIADKVDFSKIEKLKNEIEKMNKNNHIEVLRILRNGKTLINENKNGIFINMSELSSVIIDELENYVEYVLNQHKHLYQQEKVKEEFHNAYFKDKKENIDDKQNKEKTPIVTNDE